MRAASCALFVSVMAAPAAQPPQQTARSVRWSIPSEGEIRRILIDRVDTQRQTLGIVVGVIDSKGQRIISYGALNQNDARQVNGDTEFEIGSITKVFTSLLLADMVQRGEVALDDPVAKFLPAAVKMPSWGSRQITLIDLSTHTSGLPRTPSNLAPKDPDNPYADYTVDRLYEFLDSFTLRREIGTRFEYSNVGASLLGHALSRRAGMEYESLVHRRITAPLGMKDTVITLSSGQLARLATGHDGAMTPVKNWDFQVLEGGGGLRSTVNDLLKFLSAELGYSNTPLKASMAAQLEVRRPAGAPNLAVALGWSVQTEPNGTVIWHNGATGGYMSFIGFNPSTRTGVVALTNGAALIGPDDIGRHLLIGMPLAKIPATHVEITLDASAKQALVGQYRLGPDHILTISLEGDQLFVQPTGDSKIAALPESATQLFLKDLDAQLTFVMGADGKAAKLILHVNGRDDTVAPRIR
jgi:D-alanyl-D-alanine-carboxypeptidase/D-alanyl-D-alanine-endopeptidase